jgi:pimeloyl-ACP methyl ester carboxylesterase
MSHNKSTNVRIMQGVLRGSVSALAGVSTALAAHVAAELFLKSPPRRRTSDRERAALAAGTRFSVRSGPDTLSAVKWGHGPAVLLVHGWGGSGAQLESFVGPLVRAGFSAIVLDAPAHGESTGRSLSITLFADAISRIAARVGKLHGIIAHSFGAPASALAIRRGLEVERLVFIGPPADALDWFRRFSAELGFSEELELAAKRRVEQRVGIDFDQLNAHALGSALSVPLLVIHDELDAEVPVQDGARVAASAANATLVTTRGLGHRRILRDSGVIGQAVTFLGGEKAPDEAASSACLRCGAPLPDSAMRSVCERCDLELELFDPGSRWHPAVTERSPAAAV